MGGLGSGIAHDEEELHRIAGAGIHYSPTDEVLIEEGIEGWKEYELELMRDKKDNVVVVCPIENVDPGRRAHRRFHYRGACVHSDRSRVSEAS